MSKQDLVDALKEASKLGYLGGIGGGGGGGGGGGAGQWGKELSAAGDAVKGFGSAALGAGSKLAEGGARLGDVTQALSAGFSGLGASGSVLGESLAKGSKALNSLGQNIDQNIDTWRKLSDTGLSFGNDIMAMKDQASAARMSIAEMAEVMQKNNSSMLGFGATSADSAKKLSKMSNDFFTSGLGEQLRGMGYTTKELNDVLAVSISGSKLKDLKDKDGQDRSLKAAASLATEMDAVAKITGQSKQEQLDELRRKATDGQRMAAIDEAIAKGGVGAKEAFDAISANGKLMGPQFQKLAEDMASMGRPSEGMEAAYGLLSADAKKLMSEAGEAARSGDRERAAMLTKQAAAEQAAFQNTSQYRTMAAQAGIKETQESYAQGAKFRNALADAGGNINNVEESMKKLDEQVKKEQQAGGKDDPAPSAGASITRFAVDLESRGRDLTKAINDQVIQPLVKDIGPELRKAGKAMGITAQKGDVSKEDQKKIDAEKDPAKKAALQSAAEDKKAATLIDKNISEPMKAGYDKARINTVVKEEAVKDGGAGAKSSPLHNDLVEFNRLITGNQKQSDATIKVLEKIAADQSKATGKTVTAEDVAKNATNTPGAMADIVKQIKTTLPADAQLDKSESEKTKKDRLTYVTGDKEAKPAAETLGAGVEALGGLFRTTPGKVEIVGGAAPAATAENPAKEKRAGGSLDMAGKMFEDWGKGTMVELHGLEGVMRPQDISKVIESAMGGVRKTMPKIDMAAAESAGAKLDLSSMSKTISTSISSVSGGKESSVKLSADDISEMQKPFKKSFAEISDGFDELITDSSDIVKENSEKIKADIADALPVKEMAAKQEEFHSQFTEGQQKIIDDYKGYSEENRSFHAQALESGIKQDTETAQMIGDRIAKMKADISNRQATKEEEAALENETLNKAMFERQVESKKEMLDVMQNLGDYSAKRELELKQKAANEAIAIEDKKAEAIKADISAALPVDTEFGDLDGAIAKNKADDDQEAQTKQMMDAYNKLLGIDTSGMDAEAEKERQAAWDSATPEKLNAEAMTPKKSIGDIMAGLDVGANGMPIMRSIDSAKQTLTQKTPSPGKKLNENGEEYTPIEELEKQKGKKAVTEKKSESKAATTKEATLDDLLKSMNALNTKVAQLIEVNETGHKSTAKAAKSTAGNIYAR